MNFEIKSPSWYVAYTYQKSERKVQMLLDQLGIETYLPLREVKRMWSDRVKTIQLPLFANYIFVKTLENRLPRLTDLNGVVRFLVFDKKYAKIKDENIDLIRKMVEEGDKVCVEDDSFLEEQRVKITEGPFEGLEGTLIERKGRNRFVVEVEGLAKKISVEIRTNLLALSQ